MTNAPASRSDSSDRYALIGGSAGCAHDDDAREYLGNASRAAFYRCSDCDGVLVLR